MRPEIQLYASENFTPSLYASLQRALELFDELNVEEAEDDFISLLMVHDTKDPTQTCNEFIDKLNEYLDQLVSLHAVKLDDDILLHKKLDILEGLVSIEHYMDVEGLLATLEIPQEPEEKLASILELVYSLDPDEIFPLIESVDDALFIKISEIKNRQKDIESNELDKDLLDKVKLASKFYVSIEYTPVIFKLIKDGTINIGETISAYLPLFKQSELFNKMDSLNKAKELFATFIISSDGYLNPLQTYNEYSDDLFDDINTITSVSSGMGKVLNDFNSYCQSIPVKVNL